MHISVAPATRFSSPDNLTRELAQAPSHEQFTFEGADPIQFGSFDEFRDGLKFDENESNYFYINGWINESTSELDPGTLEAFAKNIRAPFKSYATFLQLWTTTDVACSGATFIRLLVFLGAERAMDMRDSLVKALRDSIADGSIRAESFTTPLRPLKAESVNEQRILVPTKSYETWKQFLKDPEKHFVEKYSAMSAALAWEAAKTRGSGFPVNVERVISGESFARQGIKLLFAQPERKTPLSGSGFDSHTDVFCLARNGIGQLISIAVEAKVDEPFDKYLVHEWLEVGKANSDGGANRHARLKSLCQMLNLNVESAQNLRYQLLHRTVAPILEAREFNCQHAVMLVHSFSQQAPQSGFEDYKKFVEALLPDETVEPNKVYGIPTTQVGMKVWIGWVQDDLPAKPGGF